MCCPLCFWSNLRNLAILQITPLGKVKTSDNTNFHFHMGHKHWSPGGKVLCLFYWRISLNIQLAENVLLFIPLSTELNGRKRWITCMLNWTLAYLYLYFMQSSSKLVFFVSGFKQLCQNTTVSYSIELFSSQKLFFYSILNCSLSEHRSKYYEHLPSHINGIPDFVKWNH